MTHGRDMKLGTSVSKDRSGRRTGPKRGFSHHPTQTPRVGLGHGRTRRDFDPEPHATNRKTRSCRFLYSTLTSR